MFWCFWVPSLLRTETLRLERTDCFQKIKTIFSFLFVAGHLSLHDLPYPIGPGALSGILIISVTAETPTGWLFMRDLCRNYIEHVHVGLRWNEPVHCGEAL